MLPLGAIQLSWNYNYIDASKALTGNSTALCQNPELVATDPACKCSSRAKKSTLLELINIIVYFHFFVHRCLGHSLVVLEDEHRICWQDLQCCCPD
jgi:hypothetical protein